MGQLFGFNLAAKSEEMHGACCPCSAVHQMSYMLYAWALKHCYCCCVAAQQVTQQPMRLATGWVCTTHSRGAAAQAATKWPTHVSGTCRL
jgi:hypothetical protein